MAGGEGGGVLFDADALAFGVVAEAGRRVVEVYAVGDGDAYAAVACASAERGDGAGVSGEV